MGSSLLSAEIAALRSRLQLTEKAAAAASTPSSKSADMFLVKRTSQFQGQQQIVSTAPYISSMVRYKETFYKAKSNQYQSCSMGSSIQVEDSHLSELVDGREAPELEAAFPHPASESDLATTSQLASRTSLGSSPCSPVGVETLWSSDKPVTGVATCCMHSRAQENFVKEDKGIASMILLLQAILVMQFNLAHSMKAAAQHQSEQRVDWGRSFTELEGMTRRMAYQWILWLHQAVWLRFLTVITLARNLVRNLVNIEKWKQVRDVFVRDANEN